MFKKNVLGPGDTHVSGSGASDVISHVRFVSLSSSSVSSVSSL